MRGAARAIAWEFQWRYRWGLAAIGGYLLVLCAVKVFIIGPGHFIRLDPPNGMAGFVIAPVSMTFFFFVGAFSYGFSGDLAARQSIYPARMLTLPITTRALAGWPMLYGTLACAALWVATALFLRAGTDGYVPLVWPALLTASYLAWMQAFMWLPYGLPGLRVVAAVVWLAIVDAVVLVALHYQASELRMAAILAPQIPLAYATARVAVARARRGEVPDWRVAFARFGHLRSERRFTTARHAQAWFEWRRHCRSLPALVGIVVPCELLLLFISGNDTAPIVFVTLIVALVMPPFLAVVAAAMVSATTPFMLTRPLTTAEVAAAKLKAAARSTVAAWAIVLIAIPLALTLSGRWGPVVEHARTAIALFGVPRAIAPTLLVVGGLMMATWRQLVQGLCIGLTGRPWLIKGTVLAALAILTALFPAVDWIVTRRKLGALWDALPLILAVLVAIKMSAAAWFVSQLHRRRLLTDRLLVGAAAAWCAAVFALYAILAWLVDTPLFPHDVLMLIAIRSVPLARLAAAPLALAWNRHR